MIERPTSSSRISPGVRSAASAGAVHSPARKASRHEKLVNTLIMKRIFNRVNVSMTIQ
jgi:hypothetical protein